MIINYDDLIQQAKKFCQPRILALGGNRVAMTMVQFAELMSKSEVGGLCKIYPRKGLMDSANSTLSGLVYKPKMTQAYKALTQLDVTDQHFHYAVQLAIPYHEEEWVDITFNIIDDQNVLVSGI